MPRLLPFIIVLALAGCVAGPSYTPQPKAPPGVVVALEAGKPNAEALEADLRGQGDGIREHADAIDAVTGGSVLPHTDALRVVAVKIQAAWERAKIIIEWMPAAIEAARAQERDLARARANEAAAIAAAQESARRQAEAEKRADEATHSAMVRNASLCGVAVLLGMVIAGAGLYPAKSMPMVIFGLLIAVVAFVGVLLFAALAWVVAHWPLVLGVVAIVLVLAGGGVWLTRRAGLWRFKAFDSAAKLLREGKVNEGIAALRVDPDFDASFEAVKDQAKIIEPKKD